MPDWLFHIGAAYLIIWILSKLDKTNQIFGKYYIFFLIGGVMPDLERILALISEFIQNYQLKEFFSVVFTSGFHTVLGVLCLGLVLTSFFPKEKTGKVFLSFVIGGLFHLLFDLIMWPWPNMGLVLFYPFIVGPRGTFSFHLVWPGGFTPLIIISVLVGLSLIIDLIQKKSIISLKPLKQFLKREN